MYQVYRYRVTAAVNRSSRHTDRSSRAGCPYAEPTDRLPHVVARTLPGDPNLALA